MTAPTEYIPGVCNIGPAEIKRRQQAGWAALIVTVALWLLLIIVDAAAPWRLLLFFPASFAALGFLQARLRFCAGFGMQGLRNFGPQAGKTDTIEQAEFRRKDRQKAIQIGLYAALIGLAVAVVAFLLT